MTRRTSTRLAKRQGKRADVDVVDMDDDVEHDATFEHDDSEKEEQQPPARKRQRVAKSSGAVTRKKQVRGKQGRLADLVNMPIDIFTEVTSHLLPGDIITLSRLNKFFRKLLMDRSAIHIWHSAMKNVQGLPPCPGGMSEPHYLALLFSKTCSMCGSAVRTNMDPVLLVKLCGSCRNTQLTPLTSLPPSIISWIQSSGGIAPTKRRSAWAYVLRGDVDDILAQYDAKRESKDAGALEQWIRERKEIVEARRNQGGAIAQFLDNLERSRDREISDIKTTRQSEIKRRLGELGWTERDMEFGSWAHGVQREWNDLVCQVKPLTDRIWTNLQPKLTVILEANREARLSMERETRRLERQYRLSDFFIEIKHRDSAVLQLKASNPITRLSNTIPTISFTYRSPFPEFAHTLDWPVVKELYETDWSVEEMGAKFEEKREEIERLITEWQNRIESQLVTRLREGYETQGETIRPTIAVSTDNPGALANVSDNLKLLLRADSLFYNSPKLSALKQPQSFGSVISNEGLTGSHSVYASSTARPAPNLDHVQWHPEAHEAARQLLADMGRPDASYLEMKAVGSVFACGRCHEMDPRNWEGMVQHYVEQKQLHAKVQEDIAQMSEAGITYNNIHGPAVLAGRPMITDYATKTLESASDPGTSRLQECKLCEKIPAAREVSALKLGIIKHLLDVHGIAEPKADEHYAPKAFSSSLFTMGGYDSDDSYDMHFGCDCPFHQMFGDIDEYGYDDEDDYW